MISREESTDIQKDLRTKAEYHQQHTTLSVLYKRLQVPLPEGETGNVCVQKPFDQLHPTMQRHVMQKLVFPLVDTIFGSLRTEALDLVWKLFFQLSPFRASLYAELRKFFVDIFLETELIKVFLA
jgi:hypothetical protein